MSTSHATNVYIEGEIYDTDTDLVTVKLLLPGAITVTNVTVNSIAAATGAATIEVRNAADGGGNGITVTFTDDAYYAEGSGTLTTSDYFYIRTGTPHGLYGINVCLLYTRS